MNILPYEECCALFEKSGLSLDKEKYDAFDKYMGLLLETNKTLNLTRITEPAEVTQKHIIDSLMIFTFIKPAGKVIDVGTGAGFPGVPMKIYDRALDMTLLDSLNKRVNFLKGISDNVVKMNCIHARAEEAGRSMREIFDMATARAVAGFDVLCEYCLPLVKVGGIFAAYKGPTEEIDTSVPEVFGGRITDIHEYSLPDGDSRRIIIVEKTAPCDAKYPRRKIK